MPFDEGRGTIPNEGGRVEPGLYCAGWIKRGPSGVIGTNKKDATETVELLFEDLAAGRLPLKGKDAAAVESDASDIGAVVDEVLRAKYSERAGRLIDHDQAGAMEMKKREGYF